VAKKQKTILSLEFGIQGSTRKYPYLEIAGRIPLQHTVEYASVPNNSWILSVAIVHRLVIDTQTDVCWAIALYRAMRYAYALHVRRALKADAHNDNRQIDRDSVIVPCCGD